MMRKLVPLFIVFPLFFSCVDNHGHRVGGGEFSVYFEDESEHQKAVELAKFWKRNDLVASKKQDIKLQKNGENYYVMIIANEPEHVKNLPFQERKLLFELQSMLEDSVFIENNVELIITDDHFNEIMNINK